jgi:hypothetical protein
MKFWNSKEWKIPKIVLIHKKSNFQQFLTGLRVVVLFSNVSFQTRNPALLSCRNMSNSAIDQEFHNLPGALG